MDTVGIQNNFKEYVEFTVINIEPYDVILGIGF
jgi:hypothetical protein